MNAPSVMIKVIVLVHFVLSVWGSMSSLMPTAYVYVNAGALACGLWAVAMPDSTDAVIMTFATLVFSAFEDIILLALYEPRAHRGIEETHQSADVRNEYRFALGISEMGNQPRSIHIQYRMMGDLSSEAVSITNLILKPVSIFLLYRIYQSRSTDTAFNIPGVDRLPGLGGMGRSGYDDIDTQRPASAPPYSASPSDTTVHADVTDKE